MYDFSELLPRIVNEVDARVQPLDQIVQKEVFLGYCTKRWDAGNYFGTFNLRVPLTVIGLRFLIVTDDLPVDVSRFQLAVNGTRVGEVLSVPAGVREGTQMFYAPVDCVDTYLSLYCLENGSAPAALGVYAIVQVEAYADTVLRKITGVLSDEYETNRFLVEQLQSLIDLDNCSSAFLPQLSHLLGFSIIHTWSTTTLRTFLKALGALVHQSGQLIPFEVLLNLLGFSQYTVYQLYKRNVYEVNDYGTIEADTADVKTYSAFLAGIVQNDTQNTSFLLPAGCTISGIEVNMGSRDVDTGVIRYSLVVNGVVDVTRYVDVASNSSHGYHTFTPLKITSTSTIGFYAHQSEPFGYADGWAEIFLDLRYSLSPLYQAARLEIRKTSDNTLLSPNPELRHNLELTRPLHVILRGEEILVLNRVDIAAESLVESVTVVSGSQVLETLTPLSDSPSKVSQLNNPLITVTCAVVCETSYQG